MFDTTAQIKDAGTGTFVYKGKWDMLDHIIISPGLLDQDGFQWKEGSSERLEYPELFYQPKFPTPRRFPRPPIPRMISTKTGTPITCPWSV